jgi:hypothetical protein
VKLHDFELAIGPAQERDTFSLRLVHSPAGQAAGTLRLLDLRRTAARTPSDGTATGDGRPAEDRSLRPCGPGYSQLEPRALGEALFEALLQGELRNAFEFTRGRVEAEGRDKSGIRFLLRLDPTDPKAMSLLDLPWELLAYPGGPGYLALGHGFSIVRSLDLRSPAAPSVLRPPLRILVVVCQPADAPALSAATEARGLVDAWSDQGDVSVEVLSVSDLSALDRAWDRRRFDCLHFIGHGLAPSGSRDGYLVLGGAGAGERSRATARQLAATLRGRELPRLVVLNACDSGRISGSCRPDPFASFAAGLLVEGIPALVAMRLPVLDSAATAFSRDFYRSLALGESLDRAVSAGRLAIYRESPDSIDWAVPALYSRLGASPLFEVSRRELPVVVAVHDSPPGAQPEPEQPEGKKLHQIQRSLPGYLDSFEIRTLADYRRLDRREQSVLGFEVLRRIIGLGSDPSDLLELAHVNVSFFGEALIEDPRVAGSVDALHRQTALYADCSLACTAEVRLPRTFGANDREPVLGDEVFALVLQHRDLIAEGKMCVVPKLVQRVGDDFTTLFNVGRLETVVADLRDPHTAAVLFERRRQGRRFTRSQGALVLSNPHGGTLSLTDILEIEDRHRAEYEHFQAHLRKTLVAVHPGDQSTALKRALHEVECGIRELEVRYRQAVEKGRENSPESWPAGSLVVVLYDDDPTVARLLEAAASETLSGHGLEYVPRIERIPDEIRRSPFFIPWLVQRREDGEL